MQEDLLFATFTPRECFRFIASMRLVKLTPEERNERVEETIQVLGLSKCADTYVGNALIRGISGGEKKRTSIGVELLINPSIIFLDEPTTGLDSTTALNVIRFLNKLAKSGRTVVSTIHQPSSEIFAEFDRLIIMVQGHIVYQGNSKQSVNYFKSIGFPIPLHSNPTDYYMKIMNKEGITLNYIEKGIPYTDEQVLREFDERIQMFIRKYKEQELSFPPVVANALGNSESQGIRHIVI
jgi:ABC-type multidrug transport system ATPase subunit